MRIAVLGATGQTGLHLVQQALDQGHSITAVVRNPDKIKIVNSNLKVVKSNIFDQTSLQEAFSEQEAVVSCLGFARKKPVTGYSESMKCIVGAMRANSIKRLVTMSTWWSDTTHGARSGFIVKYMVIPLLKPIADNMREMELYLENQCQDLDYIVVRPPRLDNGKLTGKPMTVAVDDFQVDTNKADNTTHRSDIAAFMLQQVQSTEYLHKMVAVTVQTIKQK